MLRYAIVGLLLGAACVAADDEKDPVREKLFAAKVAYDKDTAAVRKSTTDWLDKREGAARKAGDKKAVDQIKLDRKAFEEEGTLPKTAPADLQQKRTAARKALENAYTQAVKDYIRAKKDDLAAAVEKEWEAVSSGKVAAGAGAVVSGDGAVDLLALVDPKVHTVKGEWKRDGKSLTGSNGGRLQLPYEPGEEYTVEATLRRGDGDSSFCVGLVAGGQQVIALVDSWPRRGYIAGLDRVDKKDVVDNPTAVKGQLLKGDQAHSLVYTVRAGNITIAVNGTTVVDFKGEFTRLSINDRFGVPNKSALFLYIGSNTATITLDRLTVTPVKGKGTVLK
jgi:hypothetical protein